MASVLLVVGNLTLSAGDQQISDLLDGTDAASSRTDTVETRLHNNPPANFTAYDLIVVSESVSSSTFWTSYSALDTEAKPVLVIENGNWDEFRLATAAATVSSTPTLKPFSPATHYIAAGFAADGSVSFGSTGEVVDAAHLDMGAGVENVWYFGSATASSVIFAYDSGASMTSGTAPARRVAYGTKDAVFGSLAADGKTVFLAAIEWSLGEDAGGGATVTPSAIATTVALPVATPTTGATVTPAAIVATVALPAASAITALSATLLATGTGTITDVVDEADTTVDLHLSIDDDPASPNDADWVNNAVANASVFEDVTNPPTGFGTMDTTEITVRTRGQNFGTATVTLYAQLFQSDETTSLSNEVQVAQATADSAFANQVAVTFTGLNTTANKGVWDAAKVRFRWATT